MFITTVTIVIAMSIIIGNTAAITIAVTMFISIININLAFAIVVINTI